MAFSTWKEMVFSRRGVIRELYEQCKKEISDIDAGVPEDDSITTVKIKNLNVTEQKLATNAVTSGKVANGAITPAKLSDTYIDSAGITIAALTSAIAAPATLVDGTVYVVKNTSDANKIYIVTVASGAFFLSAAQTAAAT